MKRSSVDSVLDATYEVVLAVGVKRTTFADHIVQTAVIDIGQLYQNGVIADLGVFVVKTLLISEDQ